MTADPAPAAAGHGRQVDVAVIGGGQSGLALGFCLAERGVSFAILDASPSAGHVWRGRWDGLRLITPCPYNSLPGTPFPGPPWSFPTKDHVADYLDDYERRHALGVHHGVAVTAVHRDGEAFRLAVSAAGAASAAAPATPALLAGVTAQAVVVATGAFRVPREPGFAADAKLFQLHSASYRNPAQIPHGDVLVVGSGNSGAGIAQDLSASHRVTWSLGRTASAPRQILGRDLFWWAHRLGLTHLPARSWLARRMQQGPDGLIGVTPAELAERHRITLAPRTLGLAGDEATFADGSRRRFAAVVWATGFRPEHALLTPLAAAPRPLLDAHGRPIHRGGLTSVPGLAFLGLPWQRHIDSSLLGGVGRDAGHLADHLARFLTGSRRAPAPSARAAARTGRSPLDRARSTSEAS